MLPVQNKDYKVKTTLTLKNQMKIPATSNCVTHTPPPAFAKPSPKLLAFVSRTVHPEPAEQSVKPIAPVCWMVLLVVQPLVVWIAI